MTPADPLAPAVPVTVVVAARHPAIRSSLCALVGPEPGLTLAGTASELRAAIRLLLEERPVAALVDRALLGAAGLRRLPTLAAVVPDTALLLVGMGDHPGYDRRARAAGATGYMRLDRAPDVLAAAVAAAA